MIILLVLIGILLAEPVGADERFRYTSTEMPVKIWVCDKCEVIEWKEEPLSDPINIEKITIRSEMWIIVAKGDRAAIGFEADCCDYMDIISVDESRNICIISTFKNGECKKEGSVEFRKGGTYYLIFLCSRNGYGEKKLAIEKFILNKKGIYQEQTVKKIISSLSGPSYAVKKINIVFNKPGITEIKIRSKGNQKIEISGKTNLPQNTDLKYILSGPEKNPFVSIEYFDEIKVNKNGIISFEIDAQRANKNPGEYNLRIERTEREGKYLAFEKTIILPLKRQIQPIPTPRAILKTTPKIILRPKLTQTPEIKITPRSTFTPPIRIKNTTVTQRIPEPTPTPKTKSSIFLPIASIAIAAIAIFLKRKKFRNAFNQ